MSKIEELVDSGDGWVVVKASPVTPPTDLYHEWLNADLVGGTLVEYLDGCDFSIEWGRATIIEIDRSDGYLWKTDGEAFYYHWPRDDFPLSAVELRDGVYYIDVPHMWCYAMAPAGIPVPSPPAAARPQE